jgi:hypothetical protein
VYKINLYPAGLADRAARSRRLGRSAGLALLAGIGVAFLGLFLLSALSLKGRADSMRAMVTAQKARLAESAAPETRGMVGQVRLLMEQRAGRPVFAPVLAELGLILPDNLILDRIEADLTAGGGSPQRGMTLTGHLRAGQDIDPVLAFVRRLSDSPVYRREFGEAKLDRADTGGEVARFTIVCPLPPRAGVAADSAADGSGG